MLKKLFSLPIILMLFAHSAEQNYSANGVTLKSIDSSTTEIARLGQISTQAIQPAHILTSQTVFMHTPPQNYTLVRL